MSNKTTTPAPSTTVMDNYLTKMQKMSKQYIADTSPERLTVEEVRTIQNIFSRRKDGDLTIHAEAIEVLNEFRLSEFFKYLPFAMASLGQHQGDKNINEFLLAMSNVCDFLFYIAEVRDSYRSVAYFLREFDNAKQAYAVAEML